MSEIATFVLPVYWAPALVNNDWGGLDQDDINAINKWLDINPELENCFCSDDDVIITSEHDAKPVTGKILSECCNFHFLTKAQ